MLAIITTGGKCKDSEVAQIDLNKLLKGTWSYRSLHDDPDLTKPFNDLRFGAGAIEITEVGYDQIVKATLDMGSNYKLDVTGEIKRESGRVTGIYLKGEGIKGTETEGWIYEYFGNLVYRWPNGIDQKNVISGSVIRSVKHGDAPAGYVATFYMVKN